QRVCQRTFDLRVQGNLFTAKGNLYFERKDYPQALSYYNEGLQIGEKIGSPENIWKAYYGIGRTMEKKGKNQQAAKSYHQAIEKIESIRAKLKANTLKESFLDDKIDVYNSMINLLLKMGRKKDAYEYLERSKARSFLDILSTGHVNIAKGITPQRLQRKKDLERKLNKIQQELADIYSENGKEINQNRISSLEDSVKKVHYYYEQLLQEIQLKNPKYSRLTGLKKPLNLKQVQERIVQPGTALVEYLVGKERVNV
ncbi:MAG: tetratricopeptide repeat protein, partial [Calditrichaeota bacterium]|nr:tetratricopeptide repeat protein [Calditrichota bacterium]